MRREEGRETMAKRSPSVCVRLFVVSEVSSWWGEL